MKKYVIWLSRNEKEQIEADSVSFEGGVAAFYRNLPEEYWLGVVTMPTELIRAWAPGTWREVHPLGG